MKNKITVLICVLLEILSVFFICKNINTNKYSSWIETPALVKNITTLGKVYTARSNQTHGSTIFVSYLTTNKTIILYNYIADCKEGEEITLKYNPENINEVIYLPYEEKRVFRMRRNIIFVGAGLIIFTLLFYLIRSSYKRTNDIISEMESEY